MATCPRCKSDLPLLSKICPVCDLVIEEQGQASVEEIVNNLERILLKARSIKEPTFKQSVAKMIAFFVMPLITIMSLLLALVSNGLLFWIIAIGAGVYSFFGIVKRLKDKKNPDALAQLINEFDYYKGIAMRNFGKNAEVSKLVTSMQGEIYDISQSHKGASKKIFLIWAIVITVLILLGSGVFATVSTVPTEDEKKVEQMVNDGVKQEAAEAWVKLVEDYVKAGYDEISGEQARLDIVKEIVKSDVSAAEAFFKKYCQGQMGDKECAVEIVKAYKAVSEQKAQEFVKGVELRYKSDIEKLKKLL